MLGGRMIVTSQASAGPYYRYNWAERQVYFSAYHIRPNTAKDYLEGFTRYRPRFMTGYAFSHFLLAALLEEQGLQLDYIPSALVLSSEALTSEMKSQIHRVFHARAYAEYGSVEQVAFASECEHGSMHVSPDFGIVEILDDEGNPVPPGVEGNIVATGLMNTAQPLIRYRTGDLAMWSGQPCACGRDALPVLQHITGRVEDAVFLPSGGEMVRFHGIFIGLPHVVAGQIVQDDLTSLRVRVICTEAFNQQDEDLIRSRIVKERVGNINVIIEKVTELYRTPRGKIRGVICRIPPEEQKLLRSRRVTR
jgi:phenylacetate-CoA ligase